MASKGLFASAVAKLLPRTDTVNREGAPAYAYGPEAKLAQLAATGTLADNFYGVAETQLADVLQAAQAVDPYFVAQAAIYARRSGAMKDMPALLAAYLTVADPDLAVPVFRPRKWPLRRIVEAILYLLRGGLPWRMLPPGFPPVSTVRRWFYLWRDNGLWRTINHYLLMAAREACGREASPSAGVIDSQSVKTTESGGLRGYDAGKKIKGRKRHIVTDTQGFLVGAVIHTADIQDRDGAPDVLASIRRSFPWLRHVFADGGYAGDKLRKALARIEQMDHPDRQAIRYSQRL